MEYSPPLNVKTYEKSHQNVPEGNRNLLFYDRGSQFKFREAIKLKGINQPLIPQRYLMPFSSERENSCENTVSINTVFVLLVCCLCVCECVPLKNVPKIVTSTRCDTVTMRMLILMCLTHAYTMQRSINIHRG